MNEEEIASVSWRERQITLRATYGLKFRRPSIGRSVSRHAQDVALSTTNKTVIAQTEYVSLVSAPARSLTWCHPPVRFIVSTRWS
jgi:hypothetical protein